MNGNVPQQLNFKQFNTQRPEINGTNHPFADITYQNQNIQEFIQQLSEKNETVMAEIQKMETELNEMDESNQTFTRELSGNLQKYTGIIVSIKTNVVNLFSLIRNLHTQVSTTSDNNELINSLVSILNSYFNKFHLLQNQIGIVSGNNKTMKTELKQRSNNLFIAIDDLNGIFKTEFQQNGIFDIGGKLVTYAEIQNELRKYQNVNQDIKSLFSGPYNVGKYDSIEQNIDQLERLLNMPVGQQMPNNQPQIVQPPQQMPQQQQQQQQNDNIDIKNKINRIDNNLLNVQGRTLKFLLNANNPNNDSEITQILNDNKNNLNNFINQKEIGGFKKYKNRTKNKKRVKKTKRLSKRLSKRLFKRKAFRSKKV